MTNVKLYNENYYQTHKEIWKKLNSSLKHKECMKQWRNSSEGKEYMNNYNSLPRVKILKKCYQDRPDIKKRRKEYRYNWKQSETGKIYLKEYYAHYWKTPKGIICRKTDRARRRVIMKNLSVKTIQSIYETNIKQYGTLTCYLCLKPIPFGKDHLEHKIPISRRGDNKKNNLGVACASCNFRKSNKTVEEFLTEKLRSI